MNSVDLSDLAELHELFSLKWDPVIMSYLAAAGPTRFTRLAAAVSESVGERLADGDLNRALKRLREQNLVVHSAGDRTYGLTESGKKRANRINSIRTAAGRSA